MKIDIYVSKEDEDGRPDKGTKSISIANAVDQQVGLRIRSRRQEMHLSSTAVAEAIGVSFQEFQSYECGSSHVSAICMYRLAQFLEVEPSYFFATILAGKTQPKLN